jgi:hypothetical protein
MEPRWIRIIPFLHDKLTRRGKLSEPDIDDILERWLERHPEFKGRERDIRISSGCLTLPGGMRTELVTASIFGGEEIAGYDPTRDQDLYEYYLADDQGEEPDRADSERGSSS